MELRDGDLLLRPYAEADIDALVDALDDDEIVRFIPLVPVPYTRADAEVWLERCEVVWANGESCPFGIFDATTGELFGSIELKHGAMVGYWVAAGARGRGIATRALRLVCGWSTPRPLRLMTHPDNAASQRVAEKGGFRRIGMAPHLPAFRDGVAEAVLFELD